MGWPPHMATLRGVSRMKSDKLIILATLLLALIYWFATEQIKEPLIGDPIGPKAIPRLLIGGLVIAAILLWLEMLSAANARARAQRSDRSGPSETLTQDAAPGFKKHVFIVALALSTLAYFFLFDALGYALATSVYLFLMMAIFNPSRTWMNAWTAIGFSFGSYLAFTRLFGAQIPAGLLPF
jgi:putative tricarboxylic transport membrane protein